MRKLTFKPPDLTVLLLALGGVLVGLKLGHVVDWPWLAVTAAWWGPFAIAAAIFVVLGVWAAINLILPGGL